MRYGSRPRATDAAGGGGRCLRCLGAGAGGRKFVKRQRQGKFALVDRKCGVDRWVGRRGATARQRHSGSRKVLRHI